MLKGCRGPTYYELAYMKVGEKAKKTYFIDPHACPKIVQMEGVETTILTGLHDESMMMVLTTTLPGHSVPTHSHPHEQLGMVYAGQAILRIGGKERLVRKGDFYYIPPNVPHSDTAIGNKPFVMLDVFYPVREDFIRKLKAFNHRPASNQGRVRNKYECDR